MLKNLWRARGRARGDWDTEAYRDEEAATRRQMLPILATIFIFAAGAAFLFAVAALSSR